MALTNSASGLVPMVQLHDHTIKAINQRRQIRLTGGDLGFVMSVSHFVFGVSAWKSRATTLSTSGLISPLYDEYGPASASRDAQALLSAMIRLMIFSEMDIPYSLQGDAHTPVSIAPLVGLEKPL